LQRCFPLHFRDEASPNFWEKDGAFSDHLCTG
jgi:hypothetical protein